MFFIHFKNQKVSLHYFIEYEEEIIHLYLLFNSCSIFKEHFRFLVHVEYESKSML